jgi:hypothetical protein
MNARTIRISVVVVLTIVGVVWWTFRRPANNATHPNGTWWLCQNKACGHSFQLTMAQLGDWHKKHYGQRPVCPDCGSPDAVAAEKCDNCGKVYPRTQTLQPCPVCKAIPKDPRDE